MPLEFLPIGLFGILILGIFVPYWLKTKDLKKISSKDLPSDGDWAKLSKGNIYYRWHRPDQICPASATAGNHTICTFLGL